MLGLSLVYLALSLAALPLPVRAVADPTPPPALRRTLLVPSQYATISQALGAASAGDVVRVSPGVYRESALSTPPGVTLEGGGWQNTTIDGGGANVVVYGENGSMISGFTIRGSGRGYFDAGVWVSRGTVRLTGNRITGNAAGVWAWCFEPRICAIDVLLERNIIDGNSSNGVNSNDPAKFTLRNNTIALNGGAGVVLNNGGSVAENNIISSNVGDGLVNNAQATVRYNNVWGNRVDYAGGGQGAGGLSVQPLFRTGAYTLRAASPAIDAGTPAGTDMGALAFTATGGVPLSVTLLRLGGGVWDVRWTSTGAPTYHIYYGPCTRQTTSLAVVNGATSFQLTAVGEIDVGYVAVSAVYAGGESAVRLADGVRAPCPTAPLDLEVGAFPQGDMRLRWRDTSSNESGFIIERAIGHLSATTHGEFQTVAVLAADATVFTDTSLAIDETFWYRVSAFNGNGTSQPSNESFSSAFAYTPSDVERYMQVLLNEARAAPALYGFANIAPAPPVAFDPLLAYTAHAHSQSILNSGFLIGHCDPVGRCPSERARAVGYIGGVAENLIQGMTGPEWAESSMRAFMASEPHRNNLLCPCFNEAGMGHKYDPQKGGASYWKGQFTQVFSSRGGVVLPALPAGAVVPFTGEPGTQFTFLVNYYHAGGLPPSQAMVYVDGAPRPMQLRSGQAANGLYGYTMALPAGSHAYYFAYAFAGGSARLPESGSFAVGVGGVAQASPTATRASTSAATATSSATPTRASTGSATATGSATVTGSASATATRTHTAVANASATKTATATLPASRTYILHLPLVLR